MNEIYKITLPILLIIILAFVAAYQFVPPPPPKQFFFGTGRPGGAYHQFGTEYRERLAKQEVDLRLVSTAGSVESLEKLRRGALDAALVQGATAQPGDENHFRSAASVFYEPLWVFFRKDLAIDYVFDLKDKRVAIGEPGSGTRALAQLILDHNKLHATNTRLLEIPDSDAVRQLIEGSIDAAFFVSSANSDRIRDLLGNPDLELLSFRRYRAYTQLHSYLAHVVVGEGVVSLDENIPAEDKHLLAVTASLVVHKDLHPVRMRQLLMQAIDIHGQGGLLETKGQFPSEDYVELPMHPEAKRYLRHGPNWLEQIFPFWLASLINRTKIMLLPLIALAIPLARGILPLYRWRMRFQIFRWYSTLRELDKRMDSLATLEDIDHEMDHLQTLERELAEQISVPLSYMGEFYHLRMHIQMIIKKLARKRNHFVANNLGM